MVRRSKARWCMHGTRHHATLSSAFIVAIIGTTCMRACCRGMILVSEIGDKTFFIAAIMAMKNRRATV